MSGNTTSSFYSSTPNYATSYPTQNDTNSEPLTGNTQAPSSFYPNGEEYVALANPNVVLQAAALLNGFPAYTVTYAATTGALAGNANFQWGNFQVQLGDPIWSGGEKSGLYINGSDSALPMGGQVLLQIDNNGLNRFTQYSDGSVWWNMFLDNNGKWGGQTAMLVTADPHTGVIAPGLVFYGLNAGTQQAAGRAQMTYDGNSYILSLGTSNSGNNPGNMASLDPNGVVRVQSGGAYAWTNSATDSGGTSALDTGLSRSSAGVVAVGNGTPGNASGTLKANGAAFTGDVSITTTDNTPITVTSTNTSSTNVTLANTSTGGHTFSFYSTGSSNTPGHFGVYDQTTTVTMLDINGNNGNFAVVSDASFGWSTSNFTAAGGTDTTVFKDWAVGAVGLYSGTSYTGATSLRLYNTSSSGPNSTNYERGIFDFQNTANVLTIGTQAAGTGVVRPFQFAYGATIVGDYGKTNANAWTLATIASPEFSPPVKIDSTGPGNSIIQTRWVNDGFGCTLEFLKSRGTAIGTHGIVQNGDNYGQLSWYGDDGTTFQPTAAIYTIADGAPVAGTSMPSKMFFQTTPAGTIAPVTWMSINNAGVTTVGNTSIVQSASLTALTAQGNAPGFTVTGQVSNSSTTDNSVAKLAVVTGGTNEYGILQVTNGVAGAGTLTLNSGAGVTNGITISTGAGPITLSPASGQYVTAPTPTAGDNSTKVATTAFVVAAATSGGAVVYNAAQSLTATQAEQAQKNIYVPPTLTVLTSGSGTYTTKTGCTYIEVETVGGGGGGGGVPAGGSGTSTTGGGGGAGGYARLLITSPAASYSYAVGAAGGGGAAGANAGGTGGTTTFGTSLLSAVGGTGGGTMGAATASYVVAGGNGGTASGGDINASGAPGHSGVTTDSVSVGGPGAASFFGGGGSGGSNGAGHAATGYGAGGGGGGAGASGASVAGGAGAAGAIVIREYYGS